MGGQARGGVGRSEPDRKDACGENRAKGSIGPTRSGENPPVWPYGNRQAPACGPDHRDLPVVKATSDPGAVVGIVNVALAP
jgi:hypothetical protein